MSCYLRLLIPLLFTLLASCGGDGGGVNGGSSDESNSPTLSLNKSAIYADLLADKVSKQELQVTFSGDGVVAGTPANSVPMPYWLTITSTLVTATTATFELEFTAPSTAGTYTTTLRFLTGYQDSDAISYKDVAVTLTVTEPIQLSFVQVPDISIDNATTLEELTISVSLLESGSLETWRIADTSELITAQKTTEAGGINIVIGHDGLNEIDNGSHNQWIDIAYTTSHSAEEVTTRMNFDVIKNLKNIKSVTPTVIYAGNPVAMRVWGDNLNTLTDEQLLLKDAHFESVSPVNAGAVELTSEVELKVSIAIPEGVYELSIENALGLDKKTATFLVKQAPDFPIAELTLETRVTNAIYDNVREKFYYTSGYPSNEVYSIAHSDNAWAWKAYNITSPRGLALTVDGSKLIVGSHCKLIDILLVTDSISILDPNEGCHYESYGFIGQFYTGVTVVADTNQWPSMYTYPNWGDISFNIPLEHNPIGIMTQYNTHMLWAGKPSTSGQRGAFIYDVRTNTMKRWNTLGDDYYYDNLFSISAMGERVSHYADIYNDKLAYLGTLDGLANNNNDRVGISPDGSLAAMFTDEDKMIKIFDISSDTGAFTQLSHEINLSNVNLTVDRILFSEDNKTLFVFTFDTDTEISKMQVFRL